MRLSSNMVDVLIRGRDAKNVHAQVRPCEDRERRRPSASLGDRSQEHKLHIGLYIFGHYKFSFSITMLV